MIMTRMPKRSSTHLVLVLGIFFLSGCLSSIRPTGMVLDTIFVNATQTSGTIDATLSFEATGDHVANPVVLARGNLYNFTVASPGAGSFAVSLASNLTTTSYSLGLSTTEYDDEILTIGGAPWWGDHDQWDNIAPVSPFTRVTSGIQLGAGSTRTFLFYLDASHASPSIDCTLLVFHAGTGAATNPFTATWSQLDMSTPLVTVNHATSFLHHATQFPAGLSVVRFGTQGGADLTHSIVNASIAANDSARLVWWRKDMSGNFLRETTAISSGRTDALFVPAFRNTKLDGSSFPAMLVTAAPTAVNWTFHPVSDPTVSFQKIALGTTQAAFQLGKSNQAYRIFELPDVAYFDVEFTGNPVEHQAYWDVSVEFFAIGESEAAIHALDHAGMNVSEQVTIFSSRLDPRFKDSSVGFSVNQFDPFNYWILGHGQDTPVVGEMTGTRLLGMIVTATHHAMASTNLSCLLHVSTRQVLNQSDTGVLGLGVSDGHPFGDFDGFQVRAFSFENFTQFRWDITSYNVTAFDDVGTLVCNDPNDPNNRYPPNMNSALVSDNVDTDGLAGTVWLRFELTASMRALDSFHVYLYNASSKILLQSFNGNVATQVREYNITPHAGGPVRVVFNMTSVGMTGPMGPTGTGPRIDDVTIGNATDTVFRDGFEGILDQWTEIDNTGNNDSYWYIDRPSSAFNQPVVHVVYPNKVDQMTGYAVNPFYYTGFSKPVYDCNPFVQSRGTGYLVVAPDGAFKMNFTLNLKSTPLVPVNVVDSLQVKANHSYLERVASGGAASNQNVSMPDFYEYYRLRLGAGTTVRVSFSAHANEVKYIDATLYSLDGRVVHDRFPGFYGFFLINHTYEFVSGADLDVMVKLDGVAFGTTLFVSMQVATPLSEFPWFVLSTIILATTTAVAAWILVYNRRVITIPRMKPFKRK